MIDLLKADYADDDWHAAYADNADLFYADTGADYWGWLIIKALEQFDDWDADQNPHIAEISLVLRIFNYESFGQVALLRGGWNELMIAGFSHRSTGIPNGEKAFMLDDTSSTLHFMQ